MAVVLTDELTEDDCGALVLKSSGPKQVFVVLFEMFLLHSYTLQPLLPDFAAIQQTTKRAMDVRLVVKFEFSDESWEGDMSISGPTSGVQVAP